MAHSLHRLPLLWNVERLRILMNSLTPQLVRIGVCNKDCAGLSYHLEYVDQPVKFDEVVEQDGIKAIKLSFVIGSEMDWQEDALRYVFLNVRLPNYL